MLAWSYDQWYAKWQGIWGTIWDSGKEWIRAWFRFDWVDIAYHWHWIVYDLGRVADHVMDMVGHYANVAVTTVKDWVTDIIGYVEEGAATIVDRIASIWDTIVSIWSKFGATFLAGYWTVVTWVEDKTSAVVQWVLSTYEHARMRATIAWSWVVWYGATVWNWIRDKSEEVWVWIRDRSEEVWVWIRDKSGNVYNWITGVGPKVESWYNEQHAWLSDLYRNKRATLAAFLDDPGRYIADWVVDLLEYIFAEFVFRFW